MGQRTTNIFTCDGCGLEHEEEAYAHAPHGWRSLTWRSGYTGDESREAFFCESCRHGRLKALDVLLSTAIKAKED